MSAELDLKFLRHLKVPSQLILTSMVSFTTILRGFLWNVWRHLGRPSSTVRVQEKIKTKTLKAHPVRQRILTSEKIATLVVVEKKPQKSRTTTTSKGLRRQSTLLNCVCVGFFWLNHNPRAKGSSARVAAQL